MGAYPRDLIANQILEFRWILQQIAVTNSLLALWVAALFVFSSVLRKINGLLTQHARRRRRNGANDPVGWPGTCAVNGNDKAERNELEKNRGESNKEMEGGGWVLELGVCLGWAHELLGTFSYLYDMKAPFLRLRRAETHYSNTSLRLELGSSWGFIYFFLVWDEKAALANWVECICSHR